ncbi:MAG: transketolase C-terminal domain-containing protein, partial [Alphaproteobacteria bacterium]
ANTIAPSTTRRCDAHVALALCPHDLPVRLLGTGGGLVYAPLGPTHLAIEDMAIMRALPNMAVVAPGDAEEMRRFMRTTPDWPHPIYIRLGKGGDPVASREADGFAIGKAYMLREPGDVLIVSTGVMTARALDAAALLAERGVGCGVLAMPTVKPLDEAAVLAGAAAARLLVTLEEHTRVGGLGSAVVDCLIDSGAELPPILRLALPDAFPEAYGSQDSLLERYRLQPPQIAERIAANVSKLKAA